MNAEKHQTAANEKKDSSCSCHEIGPRMRFALKTLLPLLIVSAGIAGAAYLKNSGPKPRKSEPQSLVSLVQVSPVEQTREQIIVEAMGTVIPAQELLLKSRVSGEVIGMHPEFTAGGLLKAGEAILKIDPQDYELKLSRMQSQVANAVYSLKMEMGHQDVAKREWQLLGSRKAGDADRELALRKPHLEKVKADLEAARAELKQAELDLERTGIQAPFNAVVRSRKIETGSQVSAQEQLGELVGTDEYHVQVSVPIDRLGRIIIPHENSQIGSPVHIIYGGGNYERMGTVIRLLSDLENSGRMARVLIAVRDPLDLANPDANRPPMLIGEYVRVSIQGMEIPDVFRIPRTALRDNDRVWIEKQGKLLIRPVDIVWRDSHTVFLTSGVEKGENLIVSDIPAPIDNMPVRISSSDS